MAWINRFRRHCNDEQLVAFMDGELSRREAQSVQAHTTACYHCRSRLKGLEEQALTVAQLLNKDTFPQAGAVSKAIDRFWREQAGIQVKTEPAPVSRWRFLLSGRGAALAATSLALLIGFFAYFIWNSGKGFDAERILARAVAVEEPMEDTGSHQVIRVRVEAEGHYSRRVEIWRDPAGDRLSVELSDEEGRLERALWRPDHDREFRYDLESRLVSQARRPDGAAVSVLDALSAQSPDQTSLEESIMTWVTSRSRYPIMVARDFAALARQNDAVLSAVAGGAGGTALLTAKRRLDGRIVSMTVEVDLTTYRVARGVIEISGPGGPAVIELLVESYNRVSPVEFVPAVFEPNPSLLRSRSAAEAPSAMPETVRPVSAVPVILSEAESAAAEMKIRLALHRVGACRGEPIEISRDETGAVMIRGMAVTAEQLERWKTALAGLEMPDGWVVDLRVIQTEPIGRQMPEVRASTVRAVRPPVEDKLLRHFQSQQGLDQPEAGRRAAELTNQVLSVSQAALVEAWALRKLAERYPSFEELPEADRRRLERMVRDHLESLEERSFQLHRWLDPLWPVGAVASARADPSIPWNEQTLQLFTAIEKVHTSVLAMFTATGQDTTASRANPLSLGLELMRTLGAVNRHAQSLGEDVEERLWSSRQR